MQALGPWGEVLRARLRSRDSESCPWLPPACPHTSVPRVTGQRQGSVGTVCTLQSRGDGLREHRPDHMLTHEGGGSPAGSSTGAPECQRPDTTETVQS